MRLSFCAAVVALTTAVPTLAFAADAGAPKSDHDVVKLGVDIQEQLELLSRDCTTACRALQSIQRAADRICELEPGERCKDAKSKADDAARKVHASCPDCVIAQAPRKEMEKPADEERAHTGSKKGSAGAVDAAPTPANAPESVKSGGCRSCNESGTSPSDFAPALLAILAILGLRKRRR